MRRRGKVGFLLLIFSKAITYFIIATLIAITGFMILLHPPLVLKNQGDGWFGFFGSMISGFAESSQPKIARLFGMIVMGVGGFVWMVPSMFGIGEEKHEITMEDGSVQIMRESELEDLIGQSLSEAQQEYDAWQAQVIDAMKVSTGNDIAYFEDEVGAMFLYHRHTLAAAIVDFYPDELTDPSGWGALAIEKVGEVWTSEKKEVIRDTYKIYEKDLFDETFLKARHKYEEVPSIDFVEHYLATARNLWQQGHINASLLQAREARYIRSRHLGEDDPSVAEVDQMILAATQALSTGARR